ncbi:MAG TPA: MFS transporter [Acidimicrobiales bacterium]|nr:MFS transporter [Acidimicrobiales bacterium]
MGARRPGLLAPLRDRSFALLWTGMSVSLMGDGILLVALAWKVYELSNAPVALAAVGVAMTVPHVALLLVGGVVGDRFDRRRVMMASDAVRGLAVALLGALALSGHLRLWHVLGLIAVYGAATAFFGPAFDAVVPDIVPADQLVQANAIDQFARPLALRMVGPALGGLLLAAGGAATAFLVDAATFAVSIGCLLGVRPAAYRDEPEPAESPSVLADVRDGLRYVRANAWLWATFVAAAFAYLLFMGPVEVLLPYLIKNELHAGPGVFGAVLAVGGLGALAAALAVGRLGTPRRSMRFVYLAWTGSTLMLAVYAVVGAAWQVMAVSLAFSALESAGTVVWLTVKQRLVPRALLGRVSSLDWFISTGLVPLSFAVTAPLAAAVGARATFLVAGVLGAAVTLAFLFVPGVRDIDDPAALEQPVPAGLAVAA